MYKLSIDQEMKRDIERDIYEKSLEPVSVYRQGIIDAKRARDAEYLESIKRQIKLEERS